MALFYQKKQFNHESNQEQTELGVFRTFLWYCFTNCTGDNRFDDTFWQELLGKAGGKRSVKEINEELGF